MCRRQIKQSLDDLRAPQFWRAVAGEALGTMVLVFVGCGSCVNWESKEAEPLQAKASRPTIVQISLTFGLTVATMVWCLSHIGSGHINPAISAALLVTRRISVAKALLFIIAQCVGAVVGAAILKSVTPVELNSSLGHTNIADGVRPGQAFGVELVITFILAFTVYASYDENRNDIDGSRALAVGISVTVCHLSAIRYTGSSMNPARSFGPAVIGNAWQHHWIYWCGPILGGLLAGIIYEHVFAANATPAKFRNYLCCTDTKEANESGKKAPDDSKPFTNNEAHEQPAITHDESAC